MIMSTNGKNCSCGCGGNCSNPESIKAVVAEHDCDFAMNACDPRMNQTIFDTCLELKIGYLDCAMTLGTEHPLTILKFDVHCISYSIT